MKTLEQVRERGSKTLDGRDFNRIARFLSAVEFERFGLEITDERKGSHAPIPYTRENVIAQMKKDVVFGFEKLLDERALSARTMATVVGMWIWILEDDLANYNGTVLGFLEAVAEQFGFDNPLRTNQ